VIVLSAPDGGTVGVHPVVFHQVLDLLDASGWQVSQQKQGLRVLVARPGAGFDQAATEHGIQAALAATGAVAPAVHVSQVDTIPAGPAGKRPFVVALPTP
jgi:phenylacetate-CoA ligase